MQSMQSKESRKGLLVKDGSGYLQISILDFQYFYSSNSLTFGVSQNKRYVIEETIDDLFSSLSEKDFFRINRGQIISKQTINKIEPYFNHRLKVSVSNPRDQEFIVSRVRTKNFKSWLNS